MYYPGWVSHPGPRLYRLEARWSLAHLRSTAERASEVSSTTVTQRSRFLLKWYFLHVLPPGFVRIRHFGLFANRLRKVSIETCRRLLGDSGAPPPASTDTDQLQDNCRELVTDHLQHQL